LGDVGRRGIFHGGLLFSDLPNAIPLKLFSQYPKFVRFGNAGKAGLGDNKTLEKIIKTGLEEDEGDFVI
jgi:hypothetical protein